MRGGDLHGLQLVGVSYLPVRESLPPGLEVSVSRKLQLRMFLLELLVRLLEGGRRGEGASGANSG